MPRNSWKNRAIKIGMKVAGKIAGGTLSQKEHIHNSDAGHEVQRVATLARKAAAEGAVLLENKGILPLAKGTKVAVFGRTQVDYFAVGYGSGGDVNAPYQVNLLQGLRESSDITVDEVLAQQYEQWCRENPADHGMWGAWPRFHPEMPLEDATVQAAAERTEVAVLAIGRAAGEDRENNLEPGSYYLTDAEYAMLDVVTRYFSQVIVLIDSGNLMDLSWIDRYQDKLGAIMFVWQGGMESGHAIADILTGAITPSGKLTDTIAKRYTDYPAASNFGNKKYNNYAEDIYVGYRYFETFAPETVQYPFGFGRSYTKFSMVVENFAVDKERLCIRVAVQNVGDTYAGKEVVQIYYGAPQGALGKPERTLIAFAKTGDLQPGEQQTIDFTVPVRQMASFDDCGATGHIDSYVLEEGSYPIYVGADVRSAQKAGEYSQAGLQVCQKLEEVMPLPQTDKFRRLCPGEMQNGKRVKQYQDVPTGRISVRGRIMDSLPPAVIPRTQQQYQLLDVVQGRTTLDEFVAQLSPDELEAISRGDYVMDSALGTKGNAGVMGGVLPSLREKGIPPVTATDGPSGIRLHAVASLLPCGTLLACTWDTPLVEALYQQIGQEMLRLGSDILLAPGMNIHRDPLCGRNFEYFSEDPLVSGRMAGAVVRGIQSQGVSACPKHLACNNQETRRNWNDSRVSQRALREIYLRGFEICVQEAAPDHIMTSYNKINGVWSHYNYDLCTTVLRKEWGFQGNVMTDWWMRPSADPNFPRLRDNAYRVRAQVDVLMPGGKRVGKRKPDGTLLESYGKPDGITLGEMQRCAKNVLRYVMHSASYCKNYQLTYNYISPQDVCFTVSE